jgi:hypothetical protein
MPLSKSILQKTLHIFLTSISFCDWMVCWCDFVSWRTGAKKPPLFLFFRPYTMLTRLPLESILNICDNLTTNDKFKLSYTCHALNEIVTQHALFTDFNPLRLWEPQQLVVERFKNTRTTQFK